MGVLLGNHTFTIKVRVRSADTKHSIAVHDEKSLKRDAATIM